MDHAAIYRGPDRFEFVSEDGRINYIFFNSFFSFPFEFEEEKVFKDFKKSNSETKLSLLIVLNSSTILVLEIVATRICMRVINMINTGQNWLNNSIALVQYYASKSHFALKFASQMIRKRFETVLCPTRFEDIPTIETVGNNFLTTPLVKIYTEKRDLLGRIRLA